MITKKVIKMKDNRYEWRMYCLVLRQLNGINKGIQAAHSCLEYANKYRDSQELKEYIEHDKTLIILDGGTSLDIEELYEDLLVNWIDFDCFMEPDLNNMISSICFLADERVWDRKTYPDFEEWLNLKGILPPYAFNHEIYDEWEKFVGGKKNVILRDIIKNKRLSM